MSADCALPLDCSEVYGSLTIDGWSMHTGAWCAFDLSDLFDSPDFRGDNVLVETQPGRSARPVVIDETTYSLPMMFGGAVDRVGTPYTEPGGLFANRRAFTERMLDPVRSSSATLPASLVVPEGGATPTTYTAGVQPIRLEWTLLPNGYARAVLSLRIPAGHFTD